MDINKNIDQLFQEKLKNLETTPNKKVWKEIESKISKKKRRIFPFWWFSSGVAALLIIGFFVFPFNDTKHQIKQNTSKKIITKTPDKKIDSFIKGGAKIIIVQKNENKITASEKKLSIKKRDNNKLTVQINSVRKETIKISKNSVLVTKNEKNSKDKKPLIMKPILDEAKEHQALTPENEVASNNNKDSKKLDFTKSIEDYKEEKKYKNSAKKSWSIAPVFAVLNSNSFTNTSPIHHSLSGSTKGKSSISYGVQVAYQINKKWGIQSGFHLQEMRFENNQIAVISSDINASNVTFNSDENFVFESGDDTSFASTSSPLGALSLDGELAQNYSYYEIPVEIKYHLLGQNKFKTHLIGGFSTLFLQGNQIRLSTSELNEVGKATNLNNINFSGNIGINLNLNLDTNWSMHINPMLKTQFNTFTKNTNRFRPYSIGLYTGIHYKF